MNKRERRRTRKQEQVREEILVATRRVVLDKGLAGFTLTAVARELQLTKAALYHYFASKDALLHELILRDLEKHSLVVEAAVKEAASGEQALEALIRTAADYYTANMDEMRFSYMVPQVGAAGMTPPDSETVARIRPFNDRIYGTTASKIQADQQAGIIDASINARRLAFLAHTSVMGMLTVEGLVEASEDGPLIHDHRAMINDLVATFCAKLRA